MEVQDVDAQPLYYGNKPRPGGVEVTSKQWSRCHVYLKRGRGYKYAEVNARLQTEFEYSKQCLDKYGGDTGDKSAWRTLNLIPDICLFMREEFSVFVSKHCTF